jgi:NADPH:quinone reductase-like Zn-dependent oxidoreductase
MKAVVIHAYGGPEVLRYEDAPTPEPADGDVLVRVHAAGINPVDWKIREGMRRDRLKHELPLILGWDVSGTVERLGAGVTSFRVGDEVFARPDIERNGAYAEYIVIRALEVATKPRSIDHAHAAAVPLAAVTAWQALFEAPAPFTSAGLAKGQTVLIHAAAGGVGSFAVQLAKWKGAKVIATGSAHNEAFLRDLGADEIIDYTKRRFEDLVHDVDVVFDTVGGDTQARSWGVLKPGGVLVSITSRPSEDLAKQHGARAAYVFMQPDARELTEIARLVDAGHVRPVVAEVLPLSDARKAHELSQAGHVRGKLVLEVLKG